jgi:hypothetical protein
MVHRLYICSNLKSSLVGQQCDQLEGCNNTNHVISSSYNFVFNKQAKFQEGKHWWLLPTTSSTTTIKPRTVCFQGGENDEDMTCLDMTIQALSTRRMTFHQERGG